MHVLRNGPISVYRLDEMPIQSCRQTVSALRGKAGAMLNAHTELRAKRQRLAREAMYRNRPTIFWWGGQMGMARGAVWSRPLS